MQLHASCGARNGQGVLITGPSGSGKSSMLLQLMADGFRLVADDRVAIDGLTASAPAALAGIIEVRGLGLVRSAFLRSAKLALVVELGEEERLPMRRADPGTGLPVLSVRRRCPLAFRRIGLSLSIVGGRATQVCGAFV